MTRQAGRDRRTAVRRHFLICLAWAGFVGPGWVAAAEQPEQREPAQVVRVEMARDPNRIAQTVRQLRLSLTDQARAPEAVSMAEAARAAVEAEGSQVSASQRSLVLLELAQAYKSAGRYRDAERVSREVVERARAQGASSAPSLSVALRVRADMLRASGNPGAALAALVEAESALTGEGEAVRLELAGILSDRAELRMMTGDLDGAVVDGEKGLSMQRAGLPSPHVETTASIHNLARIYRARSDPGRAVPLFEEALAAIAVLRPPFHPEAAAIANNYALLLLVTGDFERARALFLRSVEIRERVFGPDHPETATGLNNLALLYWTIGAHGEALRIYERVLAIDVRTLGESHPFVATTIHNMGAVWAAQGNTEEARSRLEQALAIRQRALGPTHPSVANSLERLGAVQLQAGDALGAENLYRKGVAILAERYGPDSPDAANLSVQLASALVAQGRFDEAVDILNRSLGLSERSRAMNSVWRGYHAMARAAHGKQQSALAIYWAKEAIAVLQSLRQGLAGFDRNTQRGFVAERRHVYVELAEWLVDAGRIAESQDVLRLLKEEEYFDFILRDTRLPLGTPVIFAGTVENDAHLQLRSIRSALERLSAEIAVLERQQRSSDSQDLRDRLGRSRAEQAQASRDYEAFLGRLSGRFVQAREALRPMPAAGRVPAGVLRVQYLVGDRSVLIMASTAAGVTVHRAPIASAELSRLVAAHRSAIQARTPAVSEGRRLFDLLLAPVFSALGTQRLDSLEVSADGVLRYVPFAALHDGAGYLVERLDLSTRVDLGGAGADSPSATGRTLEAFGLTRPVAGFEALPAVRSEVERIGRTVSQANVYFDEAFTRDALERSMQRRPAMLHIASHFKFRPGTELDSYLVLGDGSRMSLRDFRNLPAGLGSSDLITLSACDTGVGGGRDETGREVDGLAATLHARGARTVVATLWPVEDQSTAALLPQMYGLHLKDRLPVTQALARVQRGLARGGTGSPTSPPFFWAAFMVIGPAR